MAKTVADLISEARSLLQDTDTPYRYSDSDLIAYLNTAMPEARRKRPDLFVTYWGGDSPSFTVADITAATDFPLDEMYYMPFVYFVVGMAELRDDEFAVDNRAVSLLNAFTGKLITGAA